MRVSGLCIVVLMGCGDSASLMSQSSGFAKVPVVELAGRIEMVAADEVLRGMPLELEVRGAPPDQDAWVFHSGDGPVDRYCIRSKSSETSPVLCREIGPSQTTGPTKISADGTATLSVETKETWPLTARWVQVAVSDSGRVWLTEPHAYSLVTTPPAIEGAAEDEPGAAESEDDPIPVTVPDAEDVEGAEEDAAVPEEPSDPDPEVQVELETEEAVPDVDEEPTTDE